MRAIRADLDATAIPIIAGLFVSEIDAISAGDRAVVVNTNPDDIINGSVVARNLGYGRDVEGIQHAFGAARHTGRVGGDKPSCCRAYIIGVVAQTLGIEYIGPNNVVTIDGGVAFVGCVY